MELDRKMTFLHILKTLLKKFFLKNTSMKCNIACANFGILVIHGEMLTYLTL